MINAIGLSPHESSVLCYENYGMQALGLGLDIRYQHRKGLMVDLYRDSKFLREIFVHDMRWFLEGYASALDWKNDTELES